MRLINGNCLNHIASLEFDHVITDAPYDLEIFPMELLRSKCDGNIITFCKPENQFFVADEYAFWEKPKSPKNNTKHLSRNMDMILISRGETFNPLPYPNMSNRWDDILEEASIFEYQKPLSLMERLVRIYTNPNDIVLDLFMGVGTTLLACQRLGRRGIGIELDGDRFEKASKRLAA